MALIIGNSNYRAIQRLSNPTNDAKLIAEALREVGFQVTVVEDGDLTAMRASVRTFSDRVGRARKDAIALLYYAGHGVQDDKNRNYLLPVDAVIASQADLVDRAVRVDYLQELLDDAQPKIFFLILDACRNNPFPAASRSAQRGLAPVDSRIRGTFIAFATAPGQIALDGEPNGNSPYAMALAAELTKPAASFEETFRRAHLKVLTSTNGAQIPWKSSSVVDEFTFVSPDTSPPGAGGTARPPGGATVTEPQNSFGDPDLEYQKAVLEDSIISYERFLQRFPRHAYRDTVVKLIAIKREDMLWRAIEQEADGNRQLLMLDRLINAFPDGSYLDRAKRHRVALIERLNPAPVLPAPPPAAFVPPRPQAALPHHPARPPSPVEILASRRWAVGNGSNCAVARKYYHLTASGGAITWRDGMGNLDIESILSSTDSRLTTRTVRSVHGQGPGVEPGSRWTYDLSDPPTVRVIPSGKSPFVLVPCR